jgi:hypothetical protein
MIMAILAGGKINLLRVSGYSTPKLLAKPAISLVRRVRRR